jgi:hypothetical protein
MFSFVPVLAALLAQTAAAPAPVTWTGTVSLGFIALTGNSQTVTFSTNAAFERKSPEWIWGIKGSAAYGQATLDTTVGGVTTSTTQVTALMGALQARGDRRFSDMLSLYLLLSLDADHLKSIEARPAAEVGVSEIWFDVKEGDFQKTTLKTDLGVRAVREYRFQYYPTVANPPDVDSLAPRVGAAYRYAFSKDVIFTEDASALLSAVGDDQGRAILTSTTKLSSHLTTTVAIGVAFAITHDTEPPPNKVKTDTALTVGLDIGI